MEVQGSDEEETALTLRANLKTFFYVTLPNIKWALLYGAVLCNARVMGSLEQRRCLQARFASQTMQLRL